MCCLERRSDETTLQPSWLVVLDGLYKLVLAFDQRPEGLEVGPAMPAQATVQAGARDIGVDELSN